MHLFLTSVLPFLAHDHPSAAAFLTCRYHNFHASIIPEFLSDEERVRSFCHARQQNELKADKYFCSSNINLYHLFVQTPLMQFSPSLIVAQNDCVESILKPLLKTKYFTRTLQRCSLVYYVPATNVLLQALAKVQSLTKFDLGECLVTNEHLEIIVNSFPSLETLRIRIATRLKIVHSTTAIRITSPLPPATTKTLRNLSMRSVDALFVTKFVPNFPNLRELVLSAQNESQLLDLLPLSSSLPLLNSLSLKYFTLENTESLKNLVHLSSLEFILCSMPDLSFLSHEENSLPDLTILCIESCRGLSNTLFASLVHTPNLNVLVVKNCLFINDCLQYLDNMVHLRKLDLSCTYVVGDSRMLKTLMQNLFQLEELNLRGCLIGNQGAIAGALYSTHSRLRVLNLRNCRLDDDDLDGIGALKNTLEVLHLSYNNRLTSEALKHCKDLVKLKVLKLWDSNRINDLSSLKDCLNLEELNVSSCRELTDDSFKVFSEEPNSFPNLQVLDLSNCDNLTEKAFEHLSKNNNLVYRLKELNVVRMSKILSQSSTSVPNSIYKLKGLRQLNGMFPWFIKDKVKIDVIRNLKNIEGVEY